MNPENEPGHPRRTRSGSELLHRLTEVLRRFWNDRRLLARLVFVGAVISVAIALLLPSYYTATTQLMPPGEQSPMSLLSAVTGGGNSPSSAAELGASLVGIRSSSAVFLGVLRSATVEDRIINRFQLKPVYRARTMADARRALENKTSVSEDRRSGIIAVSVTDTDPKRASAMAKAYVEELDRAMVELNTSAAHRERVFLEERLQRVKTELESAEADFSQFASKNAAFNIPEQGKAMMEGIGRLQGQLIAAESELKGLQAIYTDQNVRVRTVQSRIAELRHQLDKIGGVPSENAESPTKSPGASVYPSLRQLPMLGVTYADMYRRTKVQEVLFEILTKQYELAKVAEAKELPSVRVLDPAEVPERKAGPVRSNIVLLGISLAFVFGCCWILARDWWTALDPGDPAKNFGQEVFVTTEHSLRDILRPVAERLRANGKRESSVSPEPRGPDE
jgi:uncharacterized protein involved in exopolysaccharide biosynthesis